MKLLEQICKHLARTCLAYSALVPRGFLLKTGCTQKAHGAPRTCPGRTLTQIAVSVIKMYRATCWLRTPCCRFYPSCSKYALQAVEKHGLVAGLLLAAYRILRCHPFCAGGVDEVPCQIGKVNIGLKHNRYGSAVVRGLFAYIRFLAKNPLTTSTYIKYSLRKA